MADIYARVKQLEKRLTFVMTNIRMKGAISNGLLKADGTPDMKIIEGSLEDFYKLSKTAETLTEDQIDPSQLGLIDGEVTNG